MINIILDAVTVMLQALFNVLPDDLDFTGFSNALHTLWSVSYYPIKIFGKMNILFFFSILSLDLDLKFTLGIFKQIKKLITDWSPL